MQSYKTTSHGFTLVELAIVLMIIGLLIGGILKGQELIANARVTSTIQQVKGYDAAVTTFRDAYAAWPGDMLSPATRIPDCSTAPCNVPGDNNGLIDLGTEKVPFWLHLAKANMISGIDTSATTETAIAPKAFIAGQLNIQNYSPGTALLLAQSVSTGRFTPGPILQPAKAAQIDRKMDDGKPVTGNVVASPVGGRTPACASMTDYLETSTAEECMLYFLIQR